MVSTTGYVKTSIQREFTELNIQKVLAFSHLTNTNFNVLHWDFLKGFYEIMFFFLLTDVESKPRWMCPTPTTFGPTSTSAAHANHNKAVQNCELEAKDITCCSEIYYIKNRF